MAFAASLVLACANGTAPQRGAAEPADPRAEAPRLSGASSASSSPVVAASPGPRAHPGPSTPDGDPREVKVPGAVQGGVAGGSVEGPPMSSPKAPLRSIRVPIEEVRENAVYAPDCDRAALRGARPDRGETTVSFCVGANGKTRDVTTIDELADDAVVDEVCRVAVKRWRFKPFSEGGARVEVCTTVTFVFTSQ